MPQDISDRDFVNSFLKAARLRKMSVVAIYGTTEAGSLQMRVTSNVGPELAFGIISDVQHRRVSPEQLGEVAAAEEPQPS